MNDEQEFLYETGICLNESPYIFPNLFREPLILSSILYRVSEYSFYLLKFCPFHKYLSLDIGLAH